MESGRVEEERLTLWRRNGSRRGGGTAHPVEEDRLTSAWLSGGGCDGDFFLAGLVLLRVPPRGERQCVRLVCVVLCCV